MEKPKELSSAEKKELRGIAQRLKPHLQIGKNGLSKPVLGEIEIALNKNGLIKIRLETDRKNIGSLCSEISKKTTSEYVGGVGKVGIFFRDMPADEKL